MVWGLTMMALQNLVVWMVVLASSIYAVWTLMPSALRRVVATRLLRVPSPAWLRTTLQESATAGSGCGDCSGCDKAVGAKPATRTAPTGAPVQVVQFHPRRKT